MMDDVRLYVWRHGTLSVDDHYDTVDEAIRSAIHISDYGSGAPHGVEAGDEWITPDDERWRSIELAEMEAQRAALDEQPTMTHVLEVQAPDGEWAQYSGFPSLADARASAEGFDRACIRKTGPGRQYVWSNQ